MAGFIDAEEQNILDHFFGGTALASPDATHWIALFTTNPTDAGTGGTEVTGGAYVRDSYTNNVTNWPAASGTAPALKSNGIAITFIQATANWGTIVGFGIYDASTAGNLIAWGPLDSSVTINTNDTFNIAVGALKHRLGDPGDSFT